MFSVARFAIYLVFSSLIVACGGGGGGDDNSGAPAAPVVSQGRFIDAAVEGLAYTSGAQSGITDANGAFQYENGKTVRFTIGDIVIGEALGDSVMTPVTLVSGSDASHPTVVNIAALLLTLDDDGNPDNGIRISETVRDLASGMSVNFAQTTTAFVADGGIQTVVSQLTAATVAGARVLVSSSFATSHLSNSIWALYAGEYTGTISGDDSGTWSSTIRSNGSITASGRTQNSGAITASGQLTTDGTLTFATGRASSGAVFSGSTMSDGVVTGTWRNGADSGTFSGKRTDSSGGNTGGVTGPPITAGPRMVVIPAGTFTMGASVDERGSSSHERPQRQVSIQSFAMSETEVTFDDYKQYTDSQGLTLPDDLGWGTGTRPVVNVSWIDIQGYIMWLNGQTGRTYRLPTEAEWEYAARAGTTTPFSGGTGTCITTDDANYNGRFDYNNCGANTGVDRGQTVEVKSFAPNAFGLYDVMGNVWEWVQDCLHDDYTNAPTDGSAWESANSGDCSRRMLRGGSYVDFPTDLRSAHRISYDDPSGGRDPASSRFGNYGFRLAQDL